MPDYRAESTRCTALNRKGGFCDNDSLPDAPFPICVTHAALVLRFLNGVMPTSIEDRIILAARDFDFHHAKPRPNDTAGRGVIYYLRVGDKVKIGYTSDLRQRMNTYPPDSTLLAVEPGDYTLEQARHTQFIRHLKVGREWFHPAPEVMEHIAKVREQHDLTTYLPTKRRPPMPPVDKYGRPFGKASA